MLLLQILLTYKDITIWKQTAFAFIYYKYYYKWLKENLKEVFLTNNSEHTFEDTDAVQNIFVFVLLLNCFVNSIF